MKTNILRNVFSVLAAWFISLNIIAVPANPRPFTVTQKDGTQMEVRLVGDENFHYFSTTDGISLVRVDGNFYYADVTLTDQLASTGVLAHEPNLRTLSEKLLINESRERVSKHIHDVWGERLSLRNQQRALQSQQNEEQSDLHKVQRKVFGHPTTFKGQKRGIVILVNFADWEMQPTSTVEAWHDQFNKPGYNKNGHQGSVRDYFLDQSYQQLEINFDVVGPYTVSREWEYYGKQNSQGSDSHPCQLVSEACKLANADVDFKDYDWDGDGEVDQVFVIYAGYSAAAGYNDNAIWPHEWQLDYGTYYGDGNGSLRLDGVKINTYAVSSELLGTSGSTIDCIGVAVHEFSHCLGLPDFYDVDQKGTQCMDYWDVLDAGCYSGPNWRGEVPTGYTAYERHFSGWLDFEELSTPRKISGMENLGDTPQAYIFYNKGNKNEYFILENRQAKGWFKYPVGAHGLFVYHVDYDRSAWENDRPNNDPEHPRMTFIPADKSFSRNNTGEMMSDFFPGTKTVRTLNNTSHTSVFGKMFNRNSDGTYNMNMELTAITELGGKIGFTFNGGEAALKTKLKTLITEARAVMDTPHVDSEQGATEVLENAILNAEDEVTQTLTSEELLAATETLRKATVNFLFHANPTDSLQPFDVSFTLINPGITSNEGWKEETGNIGFTQANNSGEYNGVKFNLAQTTSLKLPKGLYTATVQAFQQPGDIDGGSQNTVNTSFYARTKSVKIKHILDDACDTKKNTADKKVDEGIFVPSSQKTASNYFKAGLYVNAVDFEIGVESGSTVKVGLKSLAAKTNYWTCFTNFRLYFCGNPDADAIIGVKSALPSPTTSTYDLMGRPVFSPTHGLFIQNGRKVVKWAENMK